MEAVENKPTAINRRQTRTQRFLEKLKGGLDFSLIFSMFLHVAMIIVGGIHYHDCPTEPNIPLFLLIEGVIGVVTKLLGLFRNILIKYFRVSSVISFIGTVELIYFIFGSYWVYKIYKPNYHRNSGDDFYCNKTLYLFAFIYITILYSIILLMAAGILIFLLCLCLLEKYVDQDDEVGVEIATKVENVAVK